MPRRALIRRIQNGRFKERISHAKLKSTELAPGVVLRRYSRILVEEFSCTFGASMIMKTSITTHSR
jgi:hypothetical protein